MPVFASPKDSSSILSKKAALLIMTSSVHLKVEGALDQEPEDVNSLTTSPSYNSVLCVLKP